MHQPNVSSLSNTSIMHCPQAFCAAQPTATTTADEGADEGGSPVVLLSFDQWNDILIGGALPIIAIAGLLLNALSIWVLTRPQMRNSLNVYLSALAVSDTLIVATSIPLYSLLVAECEYPWVSDIHADLAPIVYPVSRIAQTCSIYTTVVAAIDVFISVFSNRARRTVCRVPVACTVAVCIFVFSALYNVTHWYELEQFRCFHDGFDAWVYRLRPTKFRLNEVYYTVFYTYMYTIFMTLLPLATLIILNLSILVLVYIIKPPNCVQPEGMISLVLVVALFIFCNSLGLTVNLLESLQLGALFQLLINLSNVLVVCNSSFNFFIYFIFCDSFRATMRGVKHHVPIPTGETTTTTPNVKHYGCQQLLVTTTTNATNGAMVPDERTPFVTVNSHVVAIVDPRMDQVRLAPLVSIGEDSL